MKQLKIEISLSQYHEKHKIYLGGGEWLEHKSKTFLEKYLRTYKKVLLDNVRILNSYNIQIYGLYRMFFFDLSDTEVHQITQLFDDFNRSFNWMFDNRGGSQNSIVFSKLSSCVQTTFRILNILKNHGQKHKNYSLKNQSESLLKMMENFEDKFEYEKSCLSIKRNYAKKDLKIVKDEERKAI